MSSVDRYIQPDVLQTLPRIRRNDLARSTGRNVLAFIAGLATREVNTGPGPVRARAVTAENVDLGGVILESTGDAVNGDISDGDTGGGGAGGRAVLVVLLDDDTVVGDSGELDVRVGDLADITGLLVDGLDADTVGGVADSGVGDGHVLDGVVITATDRADGETVATGAGTAGERDALWV